MSLMDAHAGQLIGLIEKITYTFGMQSMEEQCCSENISHAEYRALQAALDCDICSMQDIAKSAGVTKSGATRIAKRLEGKGLAKRQQDRKDGRICCVTLTEEGRTLLKRIEGRLLNKMRKILANMDSTVREILILSLSSFVQAAERQGVDEGQKGEMRCCLMEKKNLPGND